MLGIDSYPSDNNFSRISQSKITDIALGIFYLSESGPDVLYKDFTSLKYGNIEKEKLDHIVSNVAVNTRWWRVVPCWMIAAGVSAGRPWAINCSQISGSAFNPI